MQKSSKILLGVVALLIVVLAVYVAATGKRATDREQIATQIEDARQAGEHRFTNGIFKAISADYQDSEGHNVDQLHLILTQVLRNSGRISIDLSPPIITITGDTATSASHAHIVNLEDRKAYDSDFTLHWKREDGNRLVFLPDKVWRVVGADYRMPDGE